jgi:hypothetical protein
MSPPGLRTVCRFVHAHPGQHAAGPQRAHSQLRRSRNTVLSSNFGPCIAWYPDDIAWRHLMTAAVSGRWFVAGLQRWDGRVSTRMHVRVATVLHW